MNNLLKRSIFGALYGAVMVVGLLCSYVYPLLALTVMLLSLHEFYRISVPETGSGLKPSRVSAYISAIVFLTVTYSHMRFGTPLHFMVLVLIPVLAMNLCFIFSHDHGTLDGLAYIYYGLIYVALPVGLSPILVYGGGEFSGKLLLGLFVLIWMSDIGAYVLGSTLGQRQGAHKLAPSISPKKSWWGVAGGVLFAVAGGTVMHLTRIFDFNLIHCIVLSVVICAGSITGDLCESVWKRHFGIKDSGNVIPGHGGMMDRFDSSFVAIPLGVIYLSLFSIL